MGKEYRARTFRSGNSIALRLPKALGVKEGLEMTVREEQGSFVVEPVDAPKRKIRGDWIGTMPWLTPLSREERTFEESTRPWDDKDWPRWPTGEQ